MKKTVTEVSFGEYKESDKSVTLRNSSASIGGVGSSRHLLYQDTIGALCQDDYKGPNRQYVDQGKLVICVR